MVAPAWSVGLNSGRPQQRVVIPGSVSDDGGLSDTERFSLPADSAAGEARLAALAQQIAAAEAERRAIVAAFGQRAPHENAPSQRYIDVGAVRLSFGVAGEARIVTRTAAAPPPNVPIWRPQTVELPPDPDVRADERTAVWNAFSGGATVVRIDGGKGAGASTLLRSLAHDARRHGFVDGALIINDVRGPAIDVAQRITAHAFAESWPIFRSPAQLQRQFAPIRALVLLDRAMLGAADQAELGELFPSLRFVIVDSLALAETPLISLGPLDAPAALMMLEAVNPQSVTDASERRAALEIVATVALLPGRTRLVGIAAGALGLSFSALRAQYGTGSAVIRALIASRTPLAAQILSTLAALRVPLPADAIARVAGRPVAAELRELLACELLRMPAPGVYEVPRYVESLVSATDPQPAVDLSAALREAFAAGAPAPDLDCRLVAAETFLRGATDRAAWTDIMELAPCCAELVALRGMFGAWGRILELLQTAAENARDAAMQDFVRRERSLHAQLLTDLVLPAGADSASPGEFAALEPAQRPPLPLLRRPAFFAGAVAPPVAPFGAHRAAARWAAMRRCLAGSGERLRRNRRPAVLVICALVAVALGWIWQRPAPTAVAVNQYSASPVWHAPGTSAQVDTELQRRGSGTAVAGVPHSQTHTASGAPEVPRIQSFAVRPAHVTVGQPARLCYAVTGANLLRIVPHVGELGLLRACRTITPSEPHTYTYKLIALADDGHFAIREAQLTAVAAPPVATPPVATPPSSAAPATAAQRDAASAALTARTAGAASALARRAVYQFDVTPAVVARGQAASLCVGVGRWATGNVTAIGALPPGITRCYRIRPATTTVYRLRVALDRSVAVESLTVAVRQPTHIHQVARYGHR